MELIGNKGIYKLSSKPIGKGGEGEVYLIIGDDKLVAKVYFDKKTTSEQEDKIKFMISSLLPDGFIESVAWPLDILYTKDNKFKGFIMPRISGENINLIYNDKYGQLKLEDMICFAINLCKAVENVHNIEQIIGDFNPNNIRAFLNDKSICFVDTDSFHITDSNNGRVYRCNVGTSGYLAKEIQQKASNGMRLDTAPLPTYTKESDLFALAIHIFALLTNGCSPFSGSLKMSSESITAPLPQENIKKGIFPFNCIDKNIEVPKYCPNYYSYPDYIRKLFDQTFIDGINNPKKRVLPKEWIEALTKFKKELKVCNQNKNHQYFYKLSTCPWCEANKRTDAVIMNETNFTREYVAHHSFNPKVKISSSTIQSKNKFSIHLNQKKSTTKSEIKYVFRISLIMLAASLLFHNATIYFFMSFTDIFDNFLFEPHQLLSAEIFNLIPIITYICITINSYERNKNCLHLYIIAFIVGMFGITIGTYSVVIALMVVCGYILSEL